MMPWQSLQERQRLPGFGIDHIPVLGQGEGQGPLECPPVKLPRARAGLALVDGQTAALNIDFPAWRQGGQASWTTDGFHD